MQLFSRKKREKRNFCRNIFVGFKNCRTFAVHLRNKDAYLTDRNPYITMLRSLTYLHLAQQNLSYIFVRLTLIIYVLRVIQHIRYKIIAIPKYRIYG